MYISMCAFLPRRNPIQDLHVCSSKRINTIQLKIAASVFADRIPLTILSHPLDSNKGNNEEGKVQIFVAEGESRQRVAPGQAVVKVSAHELLLKQIRICILYLARIVT